VTPGKRSDGSVLETSSARHASPLTQLSLPHVLGPCENHSQESRSVWLGYNVRRVKCLYNLFQKLAIQLCFHLLGSSRI
jgi:hypothetical protein